MSGMKSRRKGYETEAKIRQRLESEGWIVSRWNNNIDITSRQIIRSIPSRFNIQPGFPDFICIKRTRDFCYIIKFVEAKTNGYCTPEERKKLEILSEITGCKCEVASE